METKGTAWKWQEIGTTWKGVGIYHVTLSIIIQQCLMPDHFHGILYVKRQMPVGILSVVRGFWQGCKNVARKYDPSVMANTIRPNDRDNSPPLFTDKPFVRVMSRHGQQEESSMSSAMWLSYTTPLFAQPF